MSNMNHFAEVDGRITLFDHTSTADSGYTAATATEGTGLGLSILPMSRYSNAGIPNFANYSSIDHYSALTAFAEPYQPESIGSETIWPSQVSTSHPKAQSSAHASPFRTPQMATPNLVHAHDPRVCEPESILYASPQSTISNRCETPADLHSFDEPPPILEYSASDAVYSPWCSPKQPSLGTITRPSSWQGRPLSRYSPSSASCHGPSPLAAAETYIKKEESDQAMLFSYAHEDVFEQVEIERSVTAPASTQPSDADIKANPEMSTLKEKKALMEARIRRKRRQAGSGSPRGGKVVCPHCLHTFSRKHNYQQHAQTTCPVLKDRKKPYQCSTCNHAFGREHDLQRHFRSKHSNEKPLACELCDCRFDRTDSLRRHYTGKCKKKLELKMKSAARTVSSNTIPPLEISSTDLSVKEELI